MENHFYEWFGLNKIFFLLTNKIHATLLDQAILLVTWLEHPVLYPLYMVAAVLLTWPRPSMLPQKNVVVFTLSYAIASMLIIPTVKVALDFSRPLAALGEHAVVILVDAHFPADILGYTTISILVISAVYYLTGTAAKRHLPCGPDAP